MGTLREEGEGLQAHDQEDQGFVRKVGEEVIESERDLVAACLKVAKQAGVYLEVIGQRDARRSGSTKGAPDAFLYINGHCLPIEFKFGDNGLSEAQEECAYLRMMNGVFTFVLYTEKDFIRIIEVYHR